MIKITKFFLVLVLIIVFSTSCFLSPFKSHTPKTINVKIKILAQDKINIDTQGIPHPVLIKIIPLKDYQRFKQLDYLTLLKLNDSNFDRDKPHTNERIFDPIFEITVYPKENKEKSITVGEDNKYLGIVGGYINPDDPELLKQWKPIKNKTSLKLELLSNKINLTIINY